jgi:hypothetical protein
MIVAWKQPGNIRDQQGLLSCDEKAWNLNVEPCVASAPQGPIVPVAKRVVVG